MSFMRTAKAIAISTSAESNQLHRYVITGLGTAGILLVSILMGSCSDEKDLPLPELKETTYTGADKLHLKYCSEDMPGKSVKLTPQGTDAATLTLFSEFDLSQLSIKGVEGMMPCPGVIPGDVTTTLSVKLSEGNGYRSFSGTSDTGQVSFSYAGKVYADSLVLDITDAKLANLSMETPVWKLSPLEKAENGLGYKSTPFHTVWDVELPTGENVDLGKVLEAIVTVPCIPVYNGTAYSSMAQLLSQILQTMKFQPTGDIVFMYISTVGGAAHLATLNGNTIQYTVSSPQYMKLYVNPLSVAGMAMTTGVATNVYQKFENYYTGLDEDTKESLNALLPMLKQLLAQMAPQVATGIPMAYTKTDENLAIFFDLYTMQPVVETIYKVLMSDPSVKQIIASELQKYPELAELLPYLEDALTNLPAYLEKTSRFEVGLSFVPYKG